MVSSSIFDFAYTFLILYLNIYQPISDMSGSGIVIKCGGDCFPVRVCYCEWLLLLDPEEHSLLYREFAVSLNTDLTSVSHDSIYYSSLKYKDI